MIPSIAPCRADRGESLAPGAISKGVELDLGCLGTDSGIDGLVAHYRILADLDPQGVKENHRIHRLQRPGLPGGHFGHDFIGDRTDEVGRHLGGVLLQHKALDLPHRHASGVQGDDLVVEARETAFVLGDQQWIEAALTVTG